jgi:gliding motility-associated lipoprotein GldH
MRSFALLGLIALLVTACIDESRLYEKNIDLNDQQWLVNDKPVFEFVIPDTSIRYNLYCNIRNEVSYPKANLYFTYHITDSTGKDLRKGLASHFLFDKKTGEPFGSSGLGDIYDHQIPIAHNYTFNYAGKHTVMFEQFMRMDTLQGILAVGLRIEKIEPEK